MLEVFLSDRNLPRRFQNSLLLLFASTLRWYMFEIVQRSLANLTFKKLRSKITWRTHGSLLRRSSVGLCAASCPRSSRGLPADFPRSSRGVRLYRRVCSNFSKASTNSLPREKSVLESPVKCCCLLSLNLIVGNLNSNFS